MAESTADTLSTLLKVWAVLGPLLAGAASAVWSRRNRLQDREYENSLKIENRDHEHSLELELLARSDTTKNTEHLRTLQAEKYNEIKCAIADFMGSSSEYVRKQSDYWTDQTPDKHQAASQANDKFVYSCQLVILLGDELLAEAAIALSNAALAIPKSYNTPITSEYEQKLVMYRNARTEFTNQARKYLSSVRLEDEKPLLTINS